MEPVYPVFLKLAGVPCLVVGAGGVGTRKAQELLTVGAKVTLVSPVVDERCQPLLSQLEHRARGFAPEDVAGMRLVFACTGIPAVDDEVAAAARAAGALVNAADRNVGCDFYTGAVVRRGPLQVVVGTGGASPALARKVRQRLEASLPLALGELARALGEARPRLLARHPDFQERARLLDGFVERALSRLSSAVTAEEVTTWIERELLDEGPAPDEEA